MFRLLDHRHSVHLHLVTYSRCERDRGLPETEDIKGAMENGSNASNTLTVAPARGG